MTLDEINAQMFSLIGVGLVVFLTVTVLFFIITRSSVPREPLSPGVRITRGIFFACGLFTLFVLCGGIVVFIVPLPGNFITAMYPAIKPGAVAMFVRQFPETDAFMLPLIIITLAGLFGMIGGAMMASDRLARKTFEEPGDAISRVLRRVNYTVHLYGIPVICLVVIVLMLAYDTRLAKNLQTLPALLAGRAELLLVSAKSDPRGIMIAVSVVSLVALMVIMRQIAIGIRTYRWAKTEGTINTSRAGKRTFRGSTTWFFDVRYRYRIGVGSRQLTGTQFNAGFNSSYQFRAYVWYQMPRYPEGTPVTVYFDPAKPSNSVLVPGIDLFSITSKLLQWGAFSLVCFVILFQTKPM